MIPPGILDFFPLERIRPVQKQALLEVFTAFQMGKKVVILEAPPGVGKSSLAVALARYYRHNVLNLHGLIPHLSYD